MGYRVSKQPAKKSDTVPWGLTWEVYEGTKRKQKRIPKSEWSAIGFSPSMTIEEAKARAKQINSDIALKKREQRRQNIQERLREQDLKLKASLPQIFVDQFEREVIPKKRFDPTFWRTAMKVIQEVAMDTSEWSDSPEPFYEYFRKRGLSLDYLRKVFRIMNAWGFFLSKKTGKPFLPLPYPITYERNRINDSYFEKRKGDMVSRALTPEILASAKGKLSSENYNWLFISLWFGLRPEEVDSLADPMKWRHEKPKGREEILWVYQSKLLSIAREKRWKAIPVLYPEQHQAMTLIHAKAFKRPLVKTLTKAIGKGFYRYCGRKGFTDLMLSKEHRLEDISAWLGHKNIKTTWEKYKDRLQVSYARKAVGE